MEAIIGVLVAPLIIFCIFVAPIWIVFHYVFKRKNADREYSAEAGSDKKKIEELVRIADKLESRIQTLEAILDKQDPEWRNDI